MRQPLSLVHEMWRFVLFLRVGTDVHLYRVLRVPRDGTIWLSFLYIPMVEWKMVYEHLAIMINTITSNVEHSMS
jgi:hypothetical protein